MVEQRWILWSLERVQWLVAERDRVAPHEPSLAEAYDRELTGLCELLESIADSSDDFPSDELPSPPTVAPDFPLPPAPAWGEEWSAAEGLETGEEHPIADRIGQPIAEMSTLSDLPLAEPYGRRSRWSVRKRWLIPLVALALNVAAVATYLHWSRPPTVAPEPAEARNQLPVEAVEPAQRAAPKPARALAPQTTPPATDSDAPRPEPVPIHQTESTVVPEAPAPKRPRRKKRRRRRRSLKLGDSTDPLGGM